MSFRAWMSVITVVLISVVFLFSRKELAHAWQLMSGVNIWLMLLVVPINALSYLTSGEMSFSYLRQKKLISHVKPWSQMRISLELNFVNHILPSGGVSGMSYMGWRMGKYGVSSSKSIMAQTIRYVAGYAAMAVLLVVAVVAVTVDGDINRWIILMSSTLVFMMAIVTMFGIYLLKHPSKMATVAHRLARMANKTIRFLTAGHGQHTFDASKIEAFLEDIHQDYLEIHLDKRILWQPFWWGIVFTIAEIALYYVTFFALGTHVNPAAILIAYGIASLAGFIVVTPGGAGAYEALMVLVLVMAGMGQGQAIAGIVLSRAIILLVTIVMGYIFYQLSVMKYGKRATDL